MSRHCTTLIFKWLTFGRLESKNSVHFHQPYIFYCKFENRAQFNLFSLWNFNLPILHPEISTTPLKNYDFSLLIFDIKQPNLNWWFKLLYSHHELLCTHTWYEQPYHKEYYEENALNALQWCTIGHLNSKKCVLGTKLELIGTKMSYWGMVSGYLLQNWCILTASNFPLFKAIGLPKLENRNG